MRAEEEEILILFDFEFQEWISTVIEGGYKIADWL